MKEKDVELLKKSKDLIEKLNDFKTFAKEYEKDEDYGITCISESNKRGLDNLMSELETIVEVLEG